MGDPQGALENYQKALDIRLRIADLRPNDPGAIFLLTKSHSKLGLLYSRMGSTDRAEASLRESVDLVEAALTLDSAHADTRRSRWLTYHRLGEHFVEAGDLATAREWLLGAVDKLAEDAQWVGAKAPRSQAIVLMRIGDVDRYQGDSEAALESYQRCHSINTSAWERDPTQWTTGRDFALSARRVAAMLGMLERFEEALEILLEQHEVISSLAEEDSNNYQSRYDLGVSHEVLGQAYWRVDDLDLAETHLSESISIREDLATQNPDDARVQFTLASTLHDLVMYCDRGLAGTALTRCDTLQLALSHARRSTELDPAFAQSRKGIIAVLTAILQTCEDLPPSSVLELALETQDHVRLLEQRGYGDLEEVLATSQVFEVDARLDLAVDADTQLAASHALAAEQALFALTKSHSAGTITEDPLSVERIGRLIDLFGSLHSSQPEQGFNTRATTWQDRLSQSPGGG